MANNNYRRKINPKKSLGQHFLTNEHIAYDIAQTVPENNLPVLEIGPGTGALTIHLYDRFQELLYLCEIDQRSIHFLTLNYPKLAHHIITEDFLQLNLEQHFPNGLSITGNYPYNISSQIIFKVLDYVHLVPVMTGMFQKEVAQRLAAEPGNKQYGQLTVLTQLYYEVNYLFTVDKQEFDPPPKVQSGVISLHRREHIDPIDKTWFRKVVKQAFSQRRKMLRNSLKPFFPKDYLERDAFKKRPEELSVQDFIALTQEAMELSSE